MSAANEGVVLELLALNLGRRLFRGGLRDISEHASLGGGGLVALNIVPDHLAPLYGGPNPVGAMAFVRLRLD